jgi:hypothetical protein
MMTERDRPFSDGCPTPRTIGFRPLRCSSIAQVSTLAPGFLKRARMGAPLLVGRGFELF